MKRVGCLQQATTLFLCYAQKRSYCLEGKPESQACPEIKVGGRRQVEYKIQVKRYVDGGAGKLVIEAERATEGKDHIIAIFIPCWEKDQATTAHIPFQALGAIDIVVPFVQSFKAQKSSFK